MTAQLAAGVTPLVAAATQALPAPSPTVPLAPASPATWLAPNAEGVIDLVAASLRDQPGEPVNPFAVRNGSAEAGREVALQVSGIMSGTVPCAVINGRLVQTGESVESLTVERIEPDTVWLQYAGQRLRLPVSEQPARVRLPL